MKTTVSQMRNPLDGSNSSLDIVGKRNMSVKSGQKKLSTQGTERRKAGEKR